MALRRLPLGLLALSLTACAGAGPYGHAPNYVPLGDEKSAIGSAREYDPIMAQREPEAWRKQPTSLFGVVTNRGTGPAGGTYVALSVRRLEPRNLCDNMHDDDSCRVTVSDKDFGVIHALVQLTGDDEMGEHSVGGGSLLRLVGTIGEDVDPQDGTPILRATYYRHWPRYFYVTKAAASQMRH